MDAHLLIANSSFGADDLKKIAAAFDAAWDQVSPLVSSRPDVIEGARLKLASIILDLASRCEIDQARLTNAAVSLVLAHPMRLRP